MKDVRSSSSFRWIITTTEASGRIADVFTYVISNRAFTAVGRSKLKESRTDEEKHRRKEIFFETLTRFFQSNTYFHTANIFKIFSLQQDTAVKIRILKRYFWFIRLISYKVFLINAIPLNLNVVQLKTIALNKNVVNKITF